MRGNLKAEETIRQQKEARRREETRRRKNEARQHEIQRRGNKAQQREAGANFRESLSAVISTSKKNCVIACPR